MTQLVASMGKAVAEAIHQVAGKSTSFPTRTAEESRVLYECFAHRQSCSPKNRLEHSHRVARVASVRQGCHSYNPILSCVRVRAVDVHRVQLELQAVWCEQSAKPSGRDRSDQETKQTTRLARRRKCHGCFSPPLRRVRFYCRASTARTLSTNLRDLSDLSNSRPSNQPGVQLHPQHVSDHGFQLNRFRVQWLFRGCPVQTPGSGSCEFEDQGKMFAAIEQPVRRTFRLQ